MNKVFILLLIMVIVSCNRAGDHRILTSKDIVGYDYVDSTAFSSSDQKNLLLVKKSYTVDSVSNFLSVYWAIDSAGRWLLSQLIDSIELMRDGFAPDFRDYNGDGSMDLALSVGSGIRGGNEIFHLFFFDRAKRKLIKAKGIKEIVNPGYDTAKHKLFSMILSGTTHFIEYDFVTKDSIIKKTDIDLWTDNGKTYQSKKFYDPSGKLIKETLDSLKDAGESRYSPF